MPGWGRSARPSRAPGPDGDGDPAGRDPSAGGAGSGGAAPLVAAHGDPLDEAASAGTGADPILDADDAAVAAVFAAGGEDALRAAYDAYGPLVFTFCRRALGPDRAGDATQEVFLAAWRSRTRFDPAQGTLRGWLVGIARYKVLADLRAGGRRAALTVDGAVVPDGNAADAVEVLADRMVLSDALDVLPERARRSVRLAYADGLSHREIADATGVPLGTVKSDIRRGLDVLRRELGGSRG